MSIDPTPATGLPGRAHTRRTPMHHLALLVLPLAIAGCISVPPHTPTAPSATAGAYAPITAETIVQAIKDAGAEAENTSRTGNSKCPATLFFIPSSGGMNGIFYICDNPADVDATVESLGGSILPRRIYRNDAAGVVLWIPQDEVGDELAAKYEAAIAGFGK